MTPVTSPKKVNSLIPRLFNSYLGSNLRYGYTKLASLSNIIRNINIPFMRSRMR